MDHYVQLNLKAKVIFVSFMCAEPDKVARCREDQQRRSLDWRVPTHKLMGCTPGWGCMWGGGVQLCHHWEGVWTCTTHHQLMAPHSPPGHCDQFHTSLWCHLIKPSLSVLFSTGWPEPSCQLGAQWAEWTHLNWQVPVALLCLCALGNAWRTHLVWFPMSNDTARR